MPEIEEEAEVAGQAHRMENDLVALRHVRKEESFDSERQQRVSESQPRDALARRIFGQCSAEQQKRG